MTDPHDQIELVFTDDDEPQPKPKKKYTMSDKAKQTRLENLKKGREKRQAMLAKKLKLKHQERVVDEYSDDEYSDDHQPPYERPRLKYKTGRGKPREPSVQGQLNELRDMMMQLTQQNQPKKRVVHKTVIVPPQQPEEKVAPLPPPNPQVEQSRKKLWDLF